MLGSIGMPELAIIFVIALIVFGPRRLPELGRSLGQSIAEFKRATRELAAGLDNEVRAEQYEARRSSGDSRAERESTSRTASPTTAASP
jgi:sec-independent protein translocase protein TatA